jgi:hypothetical protein
VLLPGTACMPSVQAGSLAEMFVARSRWSSSQSPLTACSPYVSATERHQRDTVVAPRLDVWGGPTPDAISALLPALCAGTGTLT